MKAKVVEKVKFAPGKWKEAGALMKNFMEMAQKQGYPPRQDLRFHQWWRLYTNFEFCDRLGQPWKHGDRHGQDVF